ncbi:hypothetical protein PN419_00150 [Halorubrum ezzemoulense]|uniref:hypothetical protein n=1 Tax=Halorubrum ezzemoulense TaxID=337243 RepID=UPI00232B36AC|nr:hypothetical protein [Halorubrum ezzemoulense]MDB9247418.1 hypothetical protein [Halorubrum ezzemoulense]MDB9258673.1 hypothetical protein [Halorubrum ezzemoulense]MDB9264469.1 hypothetical protein [Halorubrum ezzemoulense]MDB9269034.1 hypothetical protein [Halorubrum ezzemoulense]MDB9271437.1 hypothetical protein [Halorubrum ezzemoulense]
MSFGDLESKLDEAREGSSTGGGSNDYEEYPRVKLTPTAAIGGQIVDIGFTGDPYEAQNIRGADGYGGDFVFTVEDPTVVRGQLFEALGRTEADDNLIRNIDPSYYPFDVDRYNDAPTRDFRVVDGASTDADHISEMVKKLDDDYEAVGIEVYGTEFPAQPIDDFDDALEAFDRVEVFVGGQAGRMMIQSVDKTQGVSAYIRDDGSKTGGLIEFPRDYGTDDWNPSGGSDYPRVARVTGPQLHSELVGEDIVLFQHFGDLDLDDEGDEADDEGDDDSGGQYRKHYGDVLWDDGDGGVILTQEDALDPETDDIDDNENWLEFHEPDGGWGSDDGDSRSSSDDSGGSFDFDELDGGDDGGETELTLDDVDADTRNFVREAAEYASGSDSIDDAFSDFDAMVESAVDDGEIGDYTPEEVRTLVGGEM